MSFKLVKEFSLDLCSHDNKCSCLTADKQIWTRFVENLGKIENQRKFAQLFGGEPQFVCVSNTLYPPLMTC